MAKSTTKTKTSTASTTATKTSTRSRSTAKTSTARTTSASARAQTTVKSKTSASPAPKAPVLPKTEPLPKTAPAAAKTDTPSTPAVVQTAQPVVVGPVLRKKELIDAAVDKSGVKRKDVKPVVEAVLEILGQALAENRELNLPPMAKVKIQKERELPNARVAIAKLRQPKPNQNGE